MSHLPIVHHCIALPGGLSEEDGDQVYINRQQKLQVILHGCALLMGCCRTYEFTSLPFPSLTAFRADCLARLGIEQGVQCSLSYQAAHGNHEELRTDGCLETFARHAGVAALSDNKKLVTLFVKVQRAAAAAEGSSEGKSTQATLNWAKIVSPAALPLLQMSADGFAVW
jgi:hypothetical protein